MAAPVSVSSSTASCLNDAKRYARSKYLVDRRYPDKKERFGALFYEDFFFMIEYATFPCKVYKNLSFH